MLLFTLPAVYVTRSIRHTARVYTVEDRWYEAVAGKTAHNGGGVGGLAAPASMAPAGQYKDRRAPGSHGLAAAVVGGEGWKVSNDEAAEAEEER